MAVPVAFSDIGKLANDVLSKDIPTGSVKLEVKTTTPNGVQFTVGGNKDNKTGIINGELKTKYSDKKNGLTFTQSWTASNHLNGQIELENQLAKGLKLDLQTSFLPTVGQKNAKIGVIYKRPNVNTKAYLDLFKTHFTVDTVVGHEGFLVGAEVGYDVLDGKVHRYTAAAGYYAPEYAVTLHAASQCSVFSAAYYHKVSKEVEASSKAVWDSKASSAAVALEVGAKYVLDKDTFIKAKVDNSGRVGLGLTQTLRPGVKLALGGNIDTTRLNENAHKFGLSLTLES